ncbi:MAG: cytochrome o ubiquinol oxidase subunit IV [Pseudomonadota bacterium]
MSEHAQSAPGSLRSYLTGFVLSVVLTVVPFWLVMGNVSASVPLVLAVIFVLGAVQILVHIHYFLHVTLQAEQGWQALSLVFTVIILVICLAGSIWVMFHLEENMMPAHEQIERARELP